MKNYERYKTAEERERSYVEYCHRHSNDGSCALCPLSTRNGKASVCSLYWLDLEVEEEKPMNCPFCNAECFVETCSEGYGVNCGESNCYIGKIFKSKSEAIAAHNSMCKAVAAYKESEGK